VGNPVPRNTRQALEFDKENGNTFWHDSIKKEITAPDLECFEFKDQDFKCAGRLPKDNIDHDIFCEA
jgi:hypothetical protein